MKKVDVNEIMDKVTSLLQDPETGVKTLTMNIFGSEKPIYKWSWMNQAIAHMNGYTDARSFKAWQSVGRCVKKGEHAFYIIKPYTFVDKKDPDNKIIAGFGVQAEFGLEQTEGDPIEDDTDVFKSAVINPDMHIVGERIGVEITTDFSSHGEGGCYIPTTKTIRISSDDPEVIYHEMSHAVDHYLGTLDPSQYIFNRNVDEVVAEYSSAILARYYSPDSQIEMSKGYMIGWSKNDLKKYMEDIFDRVKAIVNFITRTVDVLENAS